MLMTAIRYILSNKIVIAISIIVISYLSFFAYYKISRYRIESLTTKVATLEADNMQKDAYIQNLKVDYDKILKSRDELAALAESRNKNISELKKKLDRDSYGKASLKDLAKKKPTLVEKYINAEIAKQIKCFKSISSGGEC